MAATVNAAARTGALRASGEGGGSTRGLMGTAVTFAATSRCGRRCEATTGGTGAGGGKRVVRLAAWPEGIRSGGQPCGGGGRIGRTCTKSRQHRHECQAIMPVSPAC